MSLDSTIKISADATGVETGVGKAKRSLADLGKAATDAGRNAGEGLKGIGAGGDKAAKDVDRATKQLIGSIERTTATMQAGSKTSAEYFRVLANQRGVDARVLEPYLKSLEKVSASTAAVVEETGRLQSAASKIGAAIAAIGVAAVTSFGVNLVKSVVDLGDKLDDLSEKTGISVKSLTALRYAGEVSGTSFDAAAIGVRKLSQNMAAAAGGAKEQVAVFDTLGVKVKNLDGTLRGSNEVLGDLADRFASFKDGPAKAALAIEVFGKSGADMIPLLNKGSAGIAELSDEAVKLGAVFGGELAAKSAEFNDNLKRISLSLEGARTAAVAEFLPTMNELAKAFVAVREEGDSMSSSLGGGVRNVLQSISVLAANVSFVFQGIGREIGAVAAQVVALGRLDIDGFKAISEAVKEDGVRARKELDDLERRILNLGNGAGGGRGTGMDSRLLGSVGSISEQVREWQKAAPVINKVSDSASKLNKDLERQAKLLLELSGLAGDFSQKWDDLSALYKRGELSLAELVTQQAKLLALQPAIKAARESEIKLAKEYVDALEKVSAELAANFVAESKSREAFALSVTGQYGALREANEELDLERRLIGQTDRARQVAIASLRVEQSIRRQIDALNANTSFNPEQREIERQRLADLEKQLKLQIDQRDAIEGQKDSLTDLRDIFKSVESTAHDVFVNIFDGGSDAFKRLGQTLKASVLDLLYQLTVKKFIVNIGASVTGAAAPSLAGAATSALGGGNPLSSITSLFGGSGSSISGIASSLGFGNFAAGAAGVGGSFASSIGAGLATDALGATVIADAAAATIGTVGQVAGAAFSSIAAIAGPLAIGALLITQLLKGHGETRSGGQYENGQFLVGPSGGQIGPDGVSQAIGATMLSINATLQALGSSSSLAKLVSGLESSEKGKGFAYAGGALNNGAVFGQGIDGQGFMNRRGNLTPEEATKAFQTELEQATLQAIQAATDIPKTIADQLKGVDVDALSDAARQALLASINGSIVAVEGFGKAVELLPFENLKNLSFDAAAALIAAGGGLEQFTASLSSYYENFYSEEEKRRNVAGNIQATVGKAGIDVTVDQILNSTREQFRALVETFEVGSPGYNALLSVNAAFASIVPATATAIDSIEDLSGAVELTLAGALEALRNPLRTIEDIAQSIFGLETEGKGLQVELLRAQGNGPGADALQRALDTAGFTEAEVAAYDFNKALREQIDQLNAAAEAARANADANAQAASAAAQAAAQQAAAVANERQGLQDQINALTDTEAQALERVRGALDETNRALFDQVQALTAQKTAAEAAAQAQAEAAEAAAQAAAAVTQERTGLQEQLNALTDTAAQALARQRAALDESNRSIFDQIQALTAQKAAAEAAAQAATAAAQAAAAIAQQRSGLERQILELQGDTNALRKLELASIDASLRPLQERIFAMRDEAAAASQLAATLQRISSERSGLETQILQLQGNTAELRERELAALDPSNRALQEQIYLLQDQKAAADAAAAAASQSTSATSQMLQAWQAVTDSIFDEVKRIRGLLGTGGQNFARAQADFTINSAKARAGDLDAAKLLPGLSQALLELGEQNATSAFDLRRLRATTASSLEYTGGSLASQFGLNTPDGSKALIAEIAALRAEQQAQALAMAKQQAEMNQRFRNWDANGLPETRVTA